MIDRRSVQSYLTAAKKYLRAPNRASPMLSSDPKRAEKQRAELAERRISENFARLDALGGNLYRAMVESQNLLETTLRRRGLVLVESNDLSQLALPAVSGLGDLQPWEQRFLDLMGKASFRKVVRAILGAKDAGIEVDKLRTMAGASVDEYVEMLVTVNTIRRVDDKILRNGAIDNIGPTLEWYVAQICQRELHGSAAWSVVVEGLPSGGDFDVLAWLDPLLVYVEAKSAHPEQIDERDLLNFLQRTIELAPDLSILLIDTDGSTVPALNRLNEAMLPVMRKSSNAGEDWRPDKPFIRPQKNYPGMAYGFRNIYVTGGKSSIATQLRRCLQHYYSFVKGASFLSGPPLNFVTGEVGEDIW